MVVIVSGVKIKININAIFNLNIPNVSWICISYNPTSLALTDTETGALFKFKVAADV